TKLRCPRASKGVRQAIQILITARNTMTKDRTRAANALTALLPTHLLGLDVRNPLATAQILEVSKWRTRREEVALSVARSEAIRLAQRIVELDHQVSDNERQLAELVQLSKSAPLLAEKGFGVVSAAKCLAAWSHHGRVRTEAEFASLAGVNPLPASS